VQVREYVGRRLFEIYHSDVVAQFPLLAKFRKTIKKVFPKFDKKLENDAAWEEIFYKIRTEYEYNKAALDAWKDDSKNKKNK